MELVNSPVEEYGQILDIDTDDTKHVSDSDVKAFLLKSKGIPILSLFRALRKQGRMMFLSLHSPSERESVSSQGSQVYPLVSFKNYKNDQLLCLQLEKLPLSAEHALEKVSFC